MAPRKLGLLLMIALCLTLVGCQKLPDRSAPGTFRIESLPSADGIPLDFGDLVGVTTSSDRNAQLWFERPDKSIVLVRIDYVRGGVNPDVIVIPRK